ncbi:MAG: hypothetical protein AAGM16_09210 [Pseudomonadota bacterium]
MNKILIPIAAMLVAGCAPSINSFTVTPGEPGEALPASATVNKQQTIVDAVILQTRPVGGTFEDAGNLSGNGANYAGQTPRQGPGEYEARLSVKYRPAFSAAQKTKRSGIRPYSLTWPAGTFGFETGGPGWVYNGVFNTVDTFQGCPIEQLNAPPYFDITTAGWPVGIGLVNPGFPAGALRVNMSSTCYPDSDADLIDGTSFWGFELISPDLSSDANWQGIDGISFRATTNFPGLYAVALVEIEQNGVTSVVGPMAGGTFDSTQLSGSWQIIDKTGYIPADATVNRVLVRVFGQTPGLVGGPAYTFLADVISPITTE